MTCDEFILITCHEFINMRYIKSGQPIVVVPINLDDMQDAVTSLMLLRVARYYNTRGSPPQVLTSGASLGDNARAVTKITSQHESHVL
jgi:hypothetical protein